MKSITLKEKIYTKSKFFKSKLKQILVIIPLSLIALTPLANFKTVFAANGQGGNPNDQSRVLINPLSPTGGETISGTYQVKATTPLVDQSQVQSLKFCLRPGETETTVEQTELQTASEDGTTPSECVWQDMTFDNTSSSWVGSVDTTTYADGPYVIPFLLKASGVPGQKYNFVKDITISNNVDENAAPVVALQTVNVTHPNRPTDMPIRGTADIQAKIVDTDLSSYQLTITDSSGSIVYDSGKVTDDVNQPAFKTIYSWDSTKTSDGNYTITLNATDQTGQTSTTSITRTVDNTSGGDESTDEGSTTALVAINPTNGSYISGKNFVVQVSLTDPNLQFDSMVLRLQSQKSEGEETPSTLGTLETTTEEGNSPWLRMYFDQASGYWEYVLDTTQYSDGLYWMHIRAQTESGDIVEESTASLRITNLTVDNTPPNVSAGGNQTTSSKIHRTIEASDASGIASYQWQQLSGPSQVTFSTPNTPETDISATVNGDYLIQATATDLAGNSASSTFTLTWYDPTLVPTDTTVTTSQTPSSTPTIVAAPSTSIPTIDLGTVTLPPNTTLTPGQSSTPSDSLNGAVSDFNLPSNSEAQVLGGGKNSNTSWIWWIAIPAALIAVVLMTARIFTRR